MLWRSSRCVDSGAAFKSCKNCNLFDIQLTCLCRTSDPLLFRKSMTMMGKSSNIFCFSWDLHDQRCCPIATSIWTWGVVGRTVLEIICQHWRSVGHSIGNTNGDLTCWNILAYTGDALVVCGVGVSISLARCGRHTGVVTNKGIGLKVVRKCILKTPGFRRDRIEYRDDDLQFPHLVIKWFASCYSQVFLYTELPSSSPVRSLKSSIATHHSYRLRTFLPLETTLTAGSVLLAFASSLLFPLLLPLDWRSLLCSGLSSSSELLKVVGNLQDGIKQWSHASPT